MGALKAGLGNLEKHIENIAKFDLPCIVAINAFPTDTEAELQLLNECCKKLGVEVAISKVWEKGADGGIELAEKLLNKGKKNAIKVLSAKKVKIAKNKIKKYTEQGLSQLPICVAKTQYSLSDQASLLGRPTGFTVKINDIIPSAGAGFLVAISGDIMRMPGLPKRPAAVNMDIDEDGKIIGLF